MASYGHHQEPSAPPMYPNVYPVPPVRSEFMRDPQEQALLSSPPPVPKRMDDPSATRSHADTSLRRVNIKFL